MNGQSPASPGTLPAIAAARPPPLRGRLLSRASPAQNRPPCQRGLAAPAVWGIPTGCAGLPIIPADGRESLRLACARHLPLTREAFLAGSARAKRRPTQWGDSPLRGEMARSDRGVRARRAGRVSRPEGLCRAFRGRPSPVNRPPTAKGRAAALPRPSRAYPFTAVRRGQRPRRPANLTATPVPPPATSHPKRRLPHEAHILRR